MSKESKNITINLQEYNHLRDTLNQYKAIVGVLMANIAKKTEEDKYSYNVIDNNLYCENPKECINKIVTIIHYFDPFTYAFIADMVDIDRDYVDLMAKLAEIEAEGEDEEDQEEDE